MAINETQRDARITHNCPLTINAFHPVPLLFQSQGMGKVLEISLPPPFCREVQIIFPFLFLAMTTSFAICIPSTCNFKIWIPPFPNLVQIPRNLHAVNSKQESIEVALIL